MAKDMYLFTHYKNIYRVLPELTPNGDFPRDADGEIDDDYSDFYLVGKSKIKIKHGVGSTLACYIPSNGVGYNVIRQYCELMCGKQLKDYKRAAELLIKEKYIDEIDWLDGEVYFSFQAKWLDDLNKIIKLRTSGARISPLSTKNLPKVPYTIPEKDMEKYREAKDGIEPLRLGRINTEFGIETFGENFKTELKKSRLKAVQYFHKEVWDKYLEYLKGAKG